MPNKRCFVRGCINNSRSAPSKLFLTVPANVDVREQWFESVNMARNLDALPKGRNLYCCEDHFNLPEDAENWTYFKTVGTRIVLKKGILPKLNVGNASQEDSQLTLSAKKRKAETLQVLSKRQAKKKLCQESQPGCSSSDTVVSLLTPDIFTTSLAESASGTFHVERSPHKVSLTEGCVIKNKQETVPRLMKRCNRSKGTMTKPPSLSRQIVAIINIAPYQATITKPTDGSLDGSNDDISTSESFNDDINPDTPGSLYAPSAESSSSSSNINSHILSDVTVNVELYKIETNSRFYLGVPKEEYFIIQHMSQACQIQYVHILITLKKIRTNDQYCRLGIDFAKSQSYICKTVNKTAPILAARFNELIIWPEEKKIKRSLPLQFLGYFKNVQAIIDCFEVEIEKPSDPVQQALTWSQYKKCNTAKFLISCCPNGLVNFISKGFGGRSSDAEIIKQSGYLDIIPEHCRIMTDRGFKQVAHLFVKKKAVLVRPPSVSANTQMTKQESRETKLIAALRIHIERLIRRVREFEMLGPHACIHHNMIGTLDLIATIVCGMINLQGPLIRM